VREGVRRVARYHDDPIEIPSSSPGKISGVIKLAFLFIAGSLFIQTTLAANVNLGSGSSLEFGQGTQQTVACSGSQALSILPLSSFVNASNSGAYKFSSIRVSNIPTSCRDRDFILSAYTSSGNTALSIFNAGSSRAVVYMKNNDTYEVGIGGTGLSVVTNSASSFTVTFVTPVAASGDVSRVTAESTTHVVRPCSDGGICNIGDTGPGGGKIFYFAAGGFSCGPKFGPTCRYLEAAPNTWNGGTADPLLAWCNVVGSWIGGTGSIQTQNVFGAGRANTTLMIAGCASGAGVSVNTYNNSGRSSVNDWYVPTLVEFNELCKFAYSVTDNDPTKSCEISYRDGSPSHRTEFRQDSYFTSYEEHPDYARYMRLTLGMVGNITGHWKANALYVRPIRAF
jgi:hypothetical protein